MQVLTFAAGRLGIAATLALAGPVNALTLDLESLPLAARAQFQVGSNWTWTYYARQGEARRFYSEENYEVVAARSTWLTFEVKSRYKPTAALAPTTRFRVNYKHCLEAFHNPQQKVNFFIMLYPRLGSGQWGEGLESPATAFEEKFNCNGVAHASARGRQSLYETRYQNAVATAFGSVKLFQQWPKYGHNQLQAWYFADHPALAGVAYHKAFHDGSAEAYDMILTAFGSAP